MKSDYYKGLDVHFTEKERKLQKQAESEHGEASMHPLDRMRMTSHNESRKKPLTLSEAKKLGKLSIKKKDK